MVFTSFAFAKFLAVVLIGLWLMPTRALRQMLILVASAFFYAYWKPAYLLLLMTPSLIDYVCSIRIERSDSARVRRGWLLFSLITNLGLLAYFKYTNFLLDNVGALLGWQVPHLDILLPVGISFYTFKTLSYTIDVYRREIPACRSLWQYAMFVTYFPELVAGPIVRASVFLPQMTRSLRPSLARAMVGSQVALLGVTKKLLIADRLALIVDPVFANPAYFSPFTVSSAVVAYSLQIYCDFSGYSDIAIGVSKIIGFDLPENFNMPYIATSLTDFWRRWHMTLSGWLRDYLYIPLGGNRYGRWKTYRNLMLTMLLGGLWHGASWNFVFWGFLHGTGLAVNHWWTRDRGSTGGRKAVVPQGKVVLLVKWATTYVFVCLAWVFFRSRNFSTSLLIVRKLFWLDTSGANFFYSPLFMLVPVVVIGHILGVIAQRQFYAPSSSLRRCPPPAWAIRAYAGNGGRFGLKPSRVAGVYVLLPIPGFWGGFLLTVWLLVVFLFSSLKATPFIYFQF
jgi:alginate O-acetyltransferase complex protein AlgI